MATELERALFERELLEVQCLPEARRWVIERDKDVPLGILSIMHSCKAPTELYKARIRWGDYFGPFSLKFLNLQTGSETDPTAWPVCPGFRPTSLDACLPITLEGHKLHPEWMSSPVNSFPTVDAPMHFALLQVQYILDTGYSNRGRK